MRILRWSTWSMLGLALWLAVPPASRADFPLKDGDIWVMAGDSITAQHLHSNYFEAFCYAPYNKIKFGSATPGGRPHHSFHPGPFRLRHCRLEANRGLRRTRHERSGRHAHREVHRQHGYHGRAHSGIKARPVILSASPINNGNTLTNLGGNKRLHEYASALKDFAAKQQIPYGDQFHALVDIWGKNKPYEILANALPALKNAAKNADLPGVEHLRAFLAVQDKSPVPLLSLQGDAVHPGAPGQLMMAAALLKELGADRFVTAPRWMPRD